MFISFNQGTENIAQLSFSITIQEVVISFYVVICYIINIHYIQMAAYGK